jgi:hypothetical protein
MTSIALKLLPGTGLLLPSALLAAILAVVGLQAGVLRFPTFTAAALPETVVIAPRPFAYRASGEFIRGRASSSRSRRPLRLRS